MSEALLTMREVAALLRMSETWVKQHSSGYRKPVLPSVRFGRAVRFRHADVLAFIEGHRAA